MNREHDAGREYAEIWGETVEANRKLRTLAMILGGACLALAVLLLRVATVEPPRPIVVRVDEVGRAEAVAYEAATAQADPLDPTTKYFLNRFISDFYSRRQATVEEHWTRSLRFLSTELANAAFTRDGAEVAAMAAGTADTEHPGRAGRAPHPPRTGGAARRDRRLRPGPPQAGAGDPARAVVDHAPVHVPHRHPLPARRLQPDGHPDHLPPGRPGPGHGSPAMIAHLRGREAALEPFGWTGRQAEWIALVCLHSGVFTRTQATRFLDTHHERARRLVHALIAQGLAAEETVPGVRGIGRVCRIFSRGLYRALGAEHIRHRRTASADVLMRRLLSLDYVIEHSGLPWLPTEPEKVAAFEALGIERELLPSRLYRGAAGDTRRCFPLKLPVALDSDRAVFVYVDPGHDTSTALRSWGAAHRGLWHALENQGRSVEVVAVARTSREMDRALAVMSGWAEASGPGEPDAGIREEIDRIERAILQGAIQILEEFGGLQAALKRSVALEKQARRQAGRGAIHRGVAWQTVRLAGARYR